jgi:tetratricopeptide (TPR) repeat protein
VLKKLSIELWDTEDYKRVIDICKENRDLYEKFAARDFVHAYCIAALKEQVDSAENIKKMCVDCIENGDNTGVSHKLLGDIYFAENNMEDAKEYYETAKRILRNGLVLLDITKLEKEFANGKTETL